MRGLATRPSPFGDRPDGYLSYFPNARMYSIGVAEDRQRAYEQL